MGNDRDYITTDIRHYLTQAHIEFLRWVYTNKLKSLIDKHKYIME